MNTSSEYDLTLIRATGKRTNDDTIREQVDYICGRALGGARGKGWAVTCTAHNTYQRADGLWVFGYDLHFKKEKGQKGGEAEWKQWEQIKAMVEQSGENTKFAKYPWKLGTAKAAAAPTVAAPDVAAPKRRGRPPKNPAPPSSAIAASDTPSGVDSPDDVRKEKIPGLRDVVGPAKILSWDELNIPPELLGPDSDAYLAEHECFKHIFGLGPQIRTVLASIQAAKDTNGDRRYHSVLFGPPACCKTGTLLAIEQLLGEGSVLRLDATSTTRAGLEKLLFDDLRTVPPLVFCEEAEKASEEWLKIWLGALDDRGEIRKVNFRMQQVRQIKILFFATVNNKTVFDRLMGSASDSKEQGALSSRCVNQLYFPRPTQDTLKKILVREIDAHGGSSEWIQPCLDLAQQLGTDDPRRVLSFLAGGERLLTGEYQHDRLAIQSLEKQATPQPALIARTSP